MISKTYFIKDLKDPKYFSKNIEDIFFLKSIKDESNGKLLYVAILSDKTDSIKAKVWEEHVNPEFLKHADKVVKITGVVSRDVGKNYIKITGMEPVTQYNVFDLCPHVDNPSEAFSNLVKEFQSDTVKKPHLKALLDYFFNEKSAAIVAAIQGSNGFHAKIGGLIEHLTGVLHECKNTVCRLKAISSLPSSFSEEILYTGALLHDIGILKGIKSLPYTTMTAAGRYLGSTNLGLIMVSQAITKLRDSGVIFPEDEELKLLHLIVIAQCDNKDKPMCLEAEILSKKNAEEESVDALKDIINGASEDNVMDDIFRCYSQTPLKK